MPRIVLGGRYKGSTYTEVLENQRPYCLWVLETSSLPRGLQVFKDWLQSRHGGVMAVGKHRLKLFREIVDEDPAYCVRADDLPSPTVAMQKFQSWLKRHRTDVPDEQEGSKRRRVVEEEAEHREGPAALECKVCYARDINAVFAACGHLVCCMTCAARVDRCPICRVPVRSGDVIRTYTA